MSYPDSPKDKPSALPSSEPRVVRELHIDVRTITATQVRALLAMGFCEDDFTAAGGGLDRPAHHFSWETEGGLKDTAIRQKALFGQTLIVLESERGFSGYIESEIIAEEFQISFPRRAFDHGARIPLAPLTLIQTHQRKVADLHIKVPLELATPELEAEFTRIGCYFVETPKHNRIYTFQFLSHADGRQTFKLLSDFFDRAGGVVELTYEVCDAFVRVPTDLAAPPVIREGSLVRI